MMRDVTSRNGTGCTFPARTTRILPPCCTTKIRRRSAGGEVTYTGVSNVPTLTSLTPPAAAADALVSYSV